MAENSAIEWTDATWTPVRARNLITGKVGWHCEHASPGCVNCYSEAFNEKRLGTGLPFRPGHRGDVKHFLDEAMLLAPLRWRRPRRIFVCSMTDLFGDWATDAWIDRIFAVMALAPHHTFQVLTKRSVRMRAYMAKRRVDYSTTLAAAWGSIRSGVPAALEKQVLLRVWPQGGACLGRDLPWPLPNVWLGVSAEDQRRADERVPDLLETPAAVRFVSAEPLLGPIDFTAMDVEHDRGFGEIDALKGIAYAGPAVKATTSLDWIIVGGESGPGARPMHPAWATSIRDQCAAAGAAFHFKQWGAWAHSEQEPTPVPSPSFFDSDGSPTGDGWHFWTEGDRGGNTSIRVGKKAAGRLLDGVEHNGMPEVRT